MIHIFDANFVISNTNYLNCPKHNFAEFAFIGRSNVGKSSLINFLCNKKKLAKTSATPGKTQLINHFLIHLMDGQKKGKNFFLTDLPGYGYAKKSMKDRKSWSKMIEDYLTKRKELTHSFVLIDSRLPPQKIDLEFLSYLDDWKIQFSIIFTKTDKEKPAKVEKNIQLFFDELKKTWQFLPRYFTTSVELKKGDKEILEFLFNKII